MNLSLEYESSSASDSCAFLRHITRQRKTQRGPFLCTPEVLGDKWSPMSNTLQSDLSFNISGPGIGF